MSNFNLNNVKEKLLDKFPLFGAVIVNVDFIENELLKYEIENNVEWSSDLIIEDGIVKKFLEEVPQNVTEVLIDTSASVDDDLLKSFLKECKNILKFTKLETGFFDTEFYGFKPINKFSDIDKIKIIGNGGTNFNVAVKAFSRNATNKVIFTDGYATPPPKSYNVIWIVYENYDFKPNGGKVIFVDKNKLITMYSDNGKELIKKG